MLGAGRRDDDPALKDRIDGLKAIPDQAKADAERAWGILQHSGNQAVTLQMDVFEAWFGDILDESFETS